MADVVVIGGGSAGCVVASRLSEDPDRSVVLVESGEGYTSLDECPVLDSRSMPVGPASPWVARYSAELMPGVATEAIRGRVLGGSGAVNGAYFVRGPMEDFREWPASWSYADVLPYFTAMEHDHDFGGPSHGTAGPMPVRRRTVSEWSDVSSAFVSAAVAAGYPMEKDKNGTGPAGVGPVPINVSNGSRISSAVAYLLPALDRSNLTVVTGAVGHRIVFAGNRVSGVDVEQGSARTTIRTDRVVLAAGPVETPLLLTRSGVGSPDVLVQQGMSVESALPGVGRSASDHPEVLMPYRVVGNPGYGVAAPPLEVALNAHDVEIRPYTDSFGLLVPGSDVREHHLGVALMRPESRGSVRMDSSDPVIEYHYLESDADRRALREGVDAARDLLESESMRQFVEPLPIGSGDDWLRRHLTTSQHLSGTCRMGHDDDAVVDEKCRVHGVEGLYIADSSVMPVVPSRGPHATTIMIGERVAAFVADD